MKKNQTKQKVSVTPSVPLNCSTDGHNESSERDYAQIRAGEVQKLFHGLGMRKYAAAIAFIVEGEIRTAIAVEREAGLEIYERSFENSWVVQDVLDAIRRRT